MQLKTIKIMEPEEAEGIRRTLEQMNWKEGKARTKELTGTIKKNKELKPNESPAVAAISTDLCKMVVSNQEFSEFTQMQKMMAFKFNNYDEPGGTYHRHTDAPYMGDVRTDFTLVLCLTDPDTYKGGDHHVVDPLGFETIIRPRQGELMVYETGYPHWVTPVSEGTRISALSWAQSQFSQERQRGLVVTMRHLSQDLEHAMSETTDPELKAQYRKWFVDTGVVHSGLFRMWANR